MIESLLQKRCTRRELLTGMAVAGGTFLGYQHLAKPIFDRYLASYKAEFPNEFFLEDNRKNLKHLKIGGSFSPEQAFYLSNEENEGSVPQELLRIIVKELNIKDLRLGIRWSHTMFQEDKVDISSYIPYINYCLENDVNLCLNIGPIKTFRWPEQHIPFFIKEKGLPLKNSLITPDMEIAKRAKNYLGLLLFGLTSEFGNALTGEQIDVQLENEPHIKYGEFGYTMSNDYIHELVNMTRPFFPNSKFLFNTGPFVVEPVADLLKRLHGDGVKTVYGVDYYYQIDDHTNSNNWFIQLPIIKDLDLLTLSKMFGRPIIPKDLHNLDIEVTEGQFEGWGKYVKPGDSAKEFRYLLYRCINDIFEDNTDNNMLIRLWGLEAFAQKIMNKTLTPEHREIRKLMLAINQN